MEEAQRRRMRLNVSVAAVACVALGIVIAANWDSVSAGLSRVSLGTVVAVAVLHLLALLCRAEAWQLCLNAADVPLRRREVHSTSAATFLANTVLPTYFGAFVRIGLLKRLHPESAGTIGQMLAADGLLLVVEGAITVVLLLAAAFLVDLVWWWLPLVGVATGLGALAVFYVRRRYTHHAYTAAFQIVTDRRRMPVFTALLTVVLVVQPIRFYLVLDAVGLDPEALTALLAFIATTFANALPVGPGPASVGGAAAVFGGELGAAAATGLVLAATAVLAAGLYTLWALPVLWRAARRTPKPVTA